MHAKLVSRMSDSPVAPLDPFQEEDPDEDETDFVLEVARMMQHTSTTPAVTPRSESHLESRVTAMEDVLREIQQYMRRTTATVAAPIVAETSVAPTTVSPPVADGISPVKTAGTSFFCSSGTFPDVDIAAWKTQLEPLNRFEKLVTLQNGLNRGGQPRADHRVRLTLQSGRDGGGVQLDRTWFTPISRSGFFWKGVALLEK
eukprot:gene12470-8552_t